MGWQGRALEKEETIKDSLSEEKSSELDFRVVKIDIRQEEGRNWKLVSTFRKPDLYHLQLAGSEAQFRGLQSSTSQVEWNRQAGKTGDNVVWNKVRARLKNMDPELRRVKGERRSETTESLLSAGNI